MNVPAGSTPKPRQIDWQLLRQLPNFVRLYWRLFRDRRVSLFPKTLLVLSVAYIVFPFDLLPDTIPFVGELDDLVVFLAACKAFMYLCPREVVREHVQRIDGKSGS